MKSAPWVLNASTGAGALLLVARFAVIRLLLPVRSGLCPEPDAARGDDHGLRAKRELADDAARRAFSPLDIRRLEDHPADAVDGAAGDAERVDAVTEVEAQIAVGLCLARAPLERFDDAGAGT